MDGLDWKDLAEEFSFCASWSWTSSCVAFFLGFLPSFGDVFFDGVTVEKFIHGDVYTIQFFPNDSSLTEMNCTIQKSLNGTTDGEKATYKCFQKDQIWGYVTLFLMFAPGLFGGLTLWEGLQDVQIHLVSATDSHNLDLAVLPSSAATLQVGRPGQPGPHVEEVLAENDCS